jgi:hypothetical protein
VSTVERACLFAMTNFSFSFHNTKLEGIITAVRVCLKKS